MDSDRTRWRDPIRAHMAVQQLEEKLGAPTTEQPEVNDVEDVDSVETPD
jgi:hypothetical protein